MMRWRHTLAWVMTLTVGLLGSSVLSGLAVAAETQSPPPAPPSVPASSAASAADAQAQVAASAPQDAPRLGWVILSGPLREGPPPFAWAADDGSLDMRRLIQAIEQVATSPQLDGLILYLDQPQLSLSQVLALDRYLDTVRQVNKPIITFTDQYNLPGYLLACAADHVVLQRGGRVALTGLSIEEFYVAGLLEKVGLKADMVQVGQYKGALEPMTQSQPSPQWDQNIEPVLDDLFDQVVTRIAKARNLTAQQARALFTTAWTMDDQQYLDHQVVDRITSRQMSELTDDLFGPQIVRHSLRRDMLSSQRMDSPLALFQLLFQETTPRVHPNTIALIHITGPIVEGNGDASAGVSLFSTQRAASRPIIAAINRARLNPSIRGAVIRVDSPGGSALASEVIWQAIRELAQHKPVFVAVGEMAASGGYYIASAADDIWVSPSSLVGSIGVVGGKFVLGDLYEKVGLSVHRRTRGGMADMFNTVEPFTDSQRKQLITFFEKTYQQFTDRVREGRGDRLADIEAVAQGRLFTGKQAVANGMADQLGSIQDAVAAMAARLELEEGQYEVMDLPGPMSFQDFLKRMFGGVGGASLGVGGGWQQAVMQTARATLGADAWPRVEQTLDGLLLLRQEPVLLLLPTAVVVR